MTLATGGADAGRDGDCGLFAAPMGTLFTQSLASTNTAEAEFCEGYAEG